MVFLPWLLSPWLEPRGSWVAAWDLSPWFYRAPREGRANLSPPFKVHADCLESHQGGHRSFHLAMVSFPGHDRATEECTSCLCWRGFWAVALSASPFSQPPLSLSLDFRKLSNDGHNLESFPPATIKKVILMQNRVKTTSLDNLAMMCYCCVFYQGQICL